MHNKRETVGPTMVTHRDRVVGSRTIVGTSPDAEIAAAVPPAAARASPVDGHPPGGRPTLVPADPWRPVRLVLLAAYGLAYGAWLFAFGLIIDRISVLLSVAVLLVLLHVGRPRQQWSRLGVDMLLYVAMWLAYEESRGLADGLGQPLQVESVRNIDRFLFAGIDPTVWLQRRFYSAAEVRWYDVAASIVYATHFVVPVAVIVFLWVSDRPEWVRFIRRFATVLFLACGGFVLLPTAPPWMAAGGGRGNGRDALPPLARPAGRGWRHLGMDGFVHAWDTGRDWFNPVAAMPSLHAAFALFVVVFFFPWVRRRSVRLLLLGFPVAMGAALVYLAEHYVIDVIAGWVIVGISFLVWHHIELQSRRRRIAVSRGVPRPLPTVATALGGEPLVSSAVVDESEVR